MENTTTQIATNMLRATIVGACLPEEQDVILQELACAETDDGMPGLHSYQLHVT